MYRVVHFTSGRPASLQSLIVASSLHFLPGLVSSSFDHHCLRIVWWNVARRAVLAEILHFDLSFITWIGRLVPFLISAVVLFTHGRSLLLLLLLGVPAEFPQLVWHLGVQVYGELVEKGAVGMQGLVEILVVSSGPQTTTNSPEELRRILIILLDGQKKDKSI